MSSNENPLRASAQEIQDLLAKKGVASRVIEFSESTRTAQDAANVIGCVVGQILKSIIFRTTQTKRGVLVLASGVNRINEKLITQYVGEKIEKADADFVRDITGYAIGGVPPLGHKQALITYIDEDVFAYDELWAAAGTPHSVFCLRADDLKKIVQGEIVACKL